MFDQISILRNLLDENGRLEVLHGSYLWSARFVWYPSASGEEIDRLSERVDCALPEDYLAFLATVSNGAILFQDERYGQWGYRILGTNGFMERQHEWRYSIPSIKDSQYIVFAELLGEASPLAFDLRRPYLRNESCAVVECNVHDPSEQWIVASRSFHEWLDHLVTAQGDKYWLWK
jgi:hypothetical protein